GEPAIDMPGRREPLHGRHPAGDLIGQLGLAGQNVHAPDGPRVVVRRDGLDEVHDLDVAGDASGRHVGVDGMLDGRGGANGHEPGLEEAEGELLAFVRGRADETLALIVFYRPTVLTDERLETHDIEAPARDDKTGGMIGA